ncbi:MAG TPA: PAS domain S-box protein [Baekduia sp.]
MTSRPLLGWPAVGATVTYLVARGIVRSRRAEREVERIFELSLDPLCVASLDGRFVRINPAFAHALGYSRSELLHRPVVELIHPDDRPSAYDALAALAGGLELVQFENRYLRSDGSFCWLEWSVRPVPEEGRLYCAARDVSDRRRAEDELREAQRLVESSRDELHLLVDEQAALRRVATVVARGVSPMEVFDTVAAELRQLLNADATRLYRYETDGTATVLASHGPPESQIRVGTVISLVGENIVDAVRRSRHSARLESFDDAHGPLADLARTLQVRSAVGAPIVVDGQHWGVMSAAWRDASPALADAEARMVQFTDLVATAVANAESRAELKASRARIVAASDETRRRIERDLHDGTQQRLVSLALALRAAESTVLPEQRALRAELAETADGLARVVENLQEISRGIHPAILSKGGLGPALKALARRSAVPAELEVRVARPLSRPVVVAAYYVVSEALANAAKHARASVVHVNVVTKGATVVLAVRDDGVGGADPTRGSGLIGLRDRVEALGGAIDIASDPGEGTLVRARIPLGPSS